VPPEFIGTTQIGVVSAINTKQYKNKFGFIHICPGPKINLNAPRIYFNFNTVKKSTFLIRRGYLVSFTCNLDDQQRSYAADIELTEEGLKLATEREAAIEARRKDLNNPAPTSVISTGGGGDGIVAAVVLKTTTSDIVPKKVNNRRRQPKVPSKSIILKVSCEGKADIQLLTFSKYNTLGI